MPSLYKPKPKSKTPVRIPSPYKPKSKTKSPIKPKIKQKKPPKSLSKVEYPTLKYTDIANSSYKKFFKNQIEYVNSLNAKAKEAILKYTFQYDWKINQLLMKDPEKITSLKHPNLPQYFKEDLLEYGYEFVPPKDVTDVQRYIDNAFKNVEPISKKIVVYRGLKVSLKGANMKEYIHDTMYEKSYTSTSYSKSIANRFKAGYYCCLLHITIPAGSHVLPVATISQFPHEMEVLLPRNGKFIVTAQDKGVVHMTFEEDKSLYQGEKQKIKTYKEYIKHCILVIKNPSKEFSDYLYTKFTKLTWTKAKDSEYLKNLSEVAYNISHYMISYPYDIKTIPYLNEFKSISKNFYPTTFEFIITTNLGKHVLSVVNGKITEKGEPITKEGKITEKGGEQAKGKITETKGKSCNPNEFKYKKSPELYICNPETGKWVKKYGKIGKMLTKS